MLNDILHIGYPKTASTWFQKNFYPRVRNAKYIHRHKVQEQLLIPGALEWDRTKCADNLIIGNKRVAICEELLLGRLRAGGVKHFITKEIAQRLKLTFPDGKIVIFLRRQPDALASAYYQYIKAGGNYSINKFLHPEKISPGDFNPLVFLGLEYFNYLPILDYYSELFGAENLHIFLYEDFIESPKDFIIEFCKLLQLEVDIDTIDFTPINEGYRRLLVPFRRITNAFTRIGPPHKYYIANLPFVPHLNNFIFYRANKRLSWLPKPTAKKVLGAKNFSAVNDYYYKSNQAILNKYGLSTMVKHKYPLPSND